MKSPLCRRPISHARLALVALTLIGALGSPMGAAIGQTAGAPAAGPPALPTDTAAPAAPSADPLAGDTLGRASANASGIPLRSEAELIGGASVHALTAPLRWGPREWVMAGGLAAAVGVASVADEDGRAFMAEFRTDRITRIERYVEPFGAHGSLALLGGMLATGVVLDDAKLRATAAEGLAAGLVAGGIITPTLQKVIGRAKPRAGRAAYTFDAFGGDRSMPSGHTTQAFAVASVIATEYDHPAIQLAAYGTAVAVGVSRMYRRSHFFSDVVGAAMIGTFVGRTVARYGQRERGAVEVRPIVGGNGVGAAARVTF